MSTTSKKGPPKKIEWPMSLRTLDGGHKTILVTIDDAASVAECNRAGLAEMVRRGYDAERVLPFRDAEQPTKPTLTPSQIKALEYAQRCMQLTSRDKGKAYYQREHPQRSFSVLARLGLVQISACGNYYTITEAGVAWLTGAQQPQAAQEEAHVTDTPAPKSATQPTFTDEELNAMWHSISSSDAAKWPALASAVAKLDAYEQAARRARSPGNGAAR